MKSETGVTASAYSAEVYRVRVGHSIWITRTRGKGLSTYSTVVDWCWALTRRGAKARARRVMRRRAAADVRKAATREVVR